MRALLTLLTATALPMALAACATQQENPNYQFSSTYTQDSDRMTTQSAAYTLPPVFTPAPTPAPASPTPASPDVYSRVDSDCIADASCAPEGVASIAAPRVSEPWESPTEELFTGGDATPGFRAVEGSLDDSDRGWDASEPEAPTPEAMAEVPAARAPERVSGRNPALPTDPRADDIPTLTISGPIVAAESMNGTMTRALMHRVEAGDTVYSLARRYCTNVDAIRNLNSLDGSFAIRLGGDLKVPGNCR